MNLGMQKEANKGRELYSEFGGKKFARFPVKTKFATFDDELEEFIDTYAKSSFEEGDILCISAKLVSFTKRLVVHKSEVKVRPLAKLIVKFVKKWPNDIGYSHPRKMQLAIDTAGYPRIITALIVGIFMKLIGKPGYFYRVAGNNINAIDGFTEGYTKNPLFADYAYLPPKDGDAMCDELEKKYNVGVVILDGNNIENNVLGMGQKVKNLYAEQEFKQIVKDNPQGQEDDGNTTPMLIVRKI